MSTKNKLIWLIIMASLVRCIIAITVDLGNDEVYYLTYAQHLQWNYFDHPPMVALLIRITTCNLYFTNEFFIRLGPILLAAINTSMVFHLTKKIQDDNAGLLAALLFTASPYCSIIAGTFILPDAPQLFFWIISIYILVEVIQLPVHTKKSSLKILLFGIFAGLCTMSKVHGVFLWVGFGLYILFYQRKLLTDWSVYAAFIITAIIISPVIIWNIQNNFITYTFHSERVSITPHLQADSFLREFAGGMLYNNPINYFLIVFSLISILNNQVRLNTAIKRLLLLLSLPLIILLLFISLFRDTLPHWSGPAYIPLLVIAACYISQQMQYKTLAGLRLSRFTYLANAFLTIILIAGIIVVNLIPGTMGKKEQLLLGDGDVTLDMYGWTIIKKEFKKIYDTDISSRKTTTSFIISNKWFPGSHIDNYIAQPLQLDFIAIGNLNDIHTYAWLNQYRKKIEKGNDAYYITVSNYYFDPVQQYKNLFEKIEQPKVITQFRGGKPARYIYVYLLKHYTGN